MKEKILGTVQLGMSYGINNGVMPSRVDSLKLLECAYDLGIRSLDTARGYGESLEVIGEYHLKNPNKKFKIYSKFMLEDLKKDFEGMVQEQCQILSINKIHGLYFHRFHEYESRRDIILKAKKEKSSVDSIGVSIYSIDEYEKVISDAAVDIVQVPMSIFHHHSIFNKAFKEIRSEKKIYVRSIYLQGLLFLPYEKLTGKLTAFIPVRQFIDLLASRMNLTKEDLAASYIMDRENIAGVLFGAETSKQVEENSKILKGRSLDWNALLRDMPRIDEEFLNPGNWK